MTTPRDIHAYLAEFEDIPGTRVYTAKRARKGYHLNQFAMSLMKPENRARFKADEAAYLDEWKLTPAQRAAVLARDYNAMLDEGGNIYFMAKLFSTDGQSFLQAVGTMTGMSTEDYQAMMVAGGRSPDGVRSRREQAALAAVADAASEITNTPVPDGAADEERR
ncbi:protocatechuate 4,5-dioxygenase subunit alpha [Sphingomonas sp.]|jgi:protocatechuate 4,5-dioxygenase alpha chain|uniref:protocatechuate 4,5-dioxygenase subunit alpha n=1 Tax=Sphingomonas sp. TaxID=28214 RepID=UPI0035C7FA75